MALPALDLLADRGFALTLAGRPWARDLFSAYPWKLSFRLPARVSRRCGDARVDRGTAVDQLVQHRARIQAGRVFRRSATHAMRVHGYWAKPSRSTRQITWSSTTTGSLACSPAHRPRFRATCDCASASPLDSVRSDLLAAHEVGPKYVVLCPVADRISSRQAEGVGWFHAAEWRVAGRRECKSSRCRVRMNPQRCARRYRARSCCPNRMSRTFAAVLAGACLVVANDSGAGHLAAAVGARLDQRLWRNRARKNTAVEHAAPR